MSQIDEVSKNQSQFAVNPDKDFIRNRKLSMKKIITSILGMGSKSLTNELIDLYGYSVNVPSKSAFVQQRTKLKPDALKQVFNGFNYFVRSTFADNLYILAVDGSDIQIPVNPNDKATYFPGTNGQKPYNLLHLNALYDICHHIYYDAIVQNRYEYHEHKALQEMVDRSDISQALIIADRGYESYNNIAHIQEKNWFFLIRVKDGKAGIKDGLFLPDSDCFDENICINLTRKQTKDIKNLCKDKNKYRYLAPSSPFDFLPRNCRKKDPAQFYEIKFRIVRFQISESSYETVITNLDKNKYPPDELKKLYAMRWGIETSFRDLKYTLGMINFHSKKVMCILQEIYAHLIMYNFTEMITSHVVINKKQRKHTYKANFSIAANMCRMFYLGKTTSPNVEAMIARNLIPIRINRKSPRAPTIRVFRSFFYRLA